MLYLGRSVNYGYEIGKYKDSFGKHNGFGPSNEYLKLEKLPEITLEVGEIVEIALTIKKIVRPNCPECGKPKDGVKNKPKSLPEHIIENLTTSAVAKTLCETNQVVNELEHRIDQIEGNQSKSE